MSSRWILLLLAALAACAAPVRKPLPAPAPNPPVPVVAPPPLPVTVQPPPPNAEFALWLNGYRARALARGVSPAALDQLFAGVVPSQRVIELDRRQPGDSGGAAARFDTYLARQVDAARINGGIAAASRVSGRLAAVQARTGVPGEILVAIWGLETAYGRITGDFDVPAALATLAWEGRRATLFTAELDAALAIVEKGLAPRSALRGSWAGAMGQPQFLPSSYLAHAVDGDGDGRADIWNSEADTLASIGNYLKAKGWRAGLSWGLKVEVPAGFDRAQVKNPERPKTCVRPLERHSRALPARQWRDWGFTGAGNFPADATPMVLIEPDGAEQGAYLTTGNYRVIMEYNCSNFYALSVALLGDAVARDRR